jgi:hypothetical protein
MPSSFRSGISLIAAFAFSPLLSGRIGAEASDYRVSLAVNPVKFAYGLANLEIEFQTAPRVSVVVWGEYLFSTHVYVRQRHPDAVGRIGLRMFQRCREDGRADGLSVMPFVARSWTTAAVRRRKFDVGAEAAFRWQGRGEWYGSPKALATWPVGSRTLLPGIEMMLGYHLQYFH